MSQQSFKIPKISCGHCVMSIKNELSELAGVKAVDGDPTTIRETLKEINYPAE